jgi:2-amino-4-hydroxy-6-hydroxymethyldihydropteridine diphosphokinase
VQALIAVGSNTDPDQNIGRGLELLSRIEGVKIISVSRFYTSIGITEDGETLPNTFYVNGAVYVETQLTLPSLKRELQGVEDRLGRVRSSSTKPAIVTIDLDLVMARDSADKAITTESSEMQLPHPDILRREYVAIPLADIAPDWQHPTTRKTLQSIAKAMADTKMEIFEP